MHWSMAFSRQNFQLSPLTAERYSRAADYPERVRVCRAAILDGAAQFSSGVVRNEKPQKPDKTVSAVFVVYTLPPGQKRNVQTIG